LRCLATRARCLKLAALTRRRRAGFINFQMIIPTFLSERPVMTRERASHLYAVLPWVQAMEDVEIPWIVLQAAVFAVPACAAAALELMPLLLFRCAVCGARAHARTGSPSAACLLCVAASGGVAVATRCPFNKYAPVMQLSSLRLSLLQRAGKELCQPCAQSALQEVCRTRRLTARDLNAGTS
jgi:hypothetical protein